MQLTRHAQPVRTPLLTLTAHSLFKSGIVRPFFLGRVENNNHLKLINLRQKLHKRQEIKMMGKDNEHLCMVFLYEGHGEE